MVAVKLNAVVNKDARLEWLQSPPVLPIGEVEVILLYKPAPAPALTGLLATEWPLLDGGRYLGGSLRREDFYDDDGR